MTTAPTKTIDEVDARIIAQLTLDPIMTNKAIASAMGIAETTVGTRIRGMGDRGVMRVVALRDIRALGFDLIAHVYIRIEGRHPRAVAEELAASPDLAMVALDAGTPQVIVQVNARDREDLLARIERAMGNIAGIREIETSVVLRIVKFVSRYGVLLDQPEQTDERSGRDVEAHILALIAHDGRLGNREVGRRVGVSEAAVRKRIKALLDNGAVRFGVLVDPSALGLSSTALIRLKVTPGMLSDVARQIALREDISFVGLGVGAYDLMVVAAASDISQHCEFANRLVADNSGISHVEILELQSILKIDVNVVKV